MKNFGKRLKTIALFLVTVILFQSCVVYDLKRPVTLKQASEEQKKVKIRTIANKTFKYHYISFEEGVYYGVKRKSGEFTKVQLNDAEIIQVLSQNKSGSDWATVAAIALPVIAILILALTYEPTFKLGSPLSKAD